MSMPFMCGAAPSSFTVPVILPSPAALLSGPKSMPHSRLEIELTVPQQFCVDS